MTVDLGKQHLIEGLSVFGDDNTPNIFYVMPNQPRFRLDPETKKPVLKFIKYKMPIDRPDGQKGGGFFIFDCEFVVPDDKLAKVQDALDGLLQGQKDRQGHPLKAQINHIPFKSATASVTLLDASQSGSGGAAPAGGTLVSKIESPAKPSLFGSMVCPVTAELTPEGATVVEAALKGSGGITQVTYDLHFPATFPPITGTIWFNATKFYSFYQSIDKSGGNWCSSDNTENDTLRENFINSSSGNVSFNFGDLGYLDADTAKKVQNDVTSWGWSQVDEAAKAVALQDVKPVDDRGDHGMEHIKKNQTNYQQASFYRNLTERMGLDFESPQGGTLPSISDMGFKLEDFLTEIDANDPFFAQIMASVAVNADFDRFGIDSVDVHCEYTKINPPTIKDFHFSKADDIAKFDSDTANGDMGWAYSFSVNYKDQSQPYTSPLIQTNKGHVTIDANDLGILCFDLLIGDVDFAKTPQVQVAVTYPDPDANGQPISAQFNFDTNKKSDKMLAVLLKPVDKSYRYQTTYIMADSSQVVTDWIESQSTSIHINSPFVMHTFSFLAEGDFSSQIDNIFLKMSYSDPTNKVEQETDTTFKNGSQQYDWKIPIVQNSKGTITYSGVIQYKNRTTESIPATSTTADLIEFGPPNQAAVSVVPDTTLIDFSQVKAIKLDLEYKDPAHNIDLKHEFVLKQGASPQPWTFYARDPNITSYTYAATFYMNTNPPQVVKVPPATSSDTTLLLAMPS